MLNGDLFYTLDYNPILLYFVTQIVPALTTWSFSKIGSCVPVTYPPTNMWLLLFAYFFNLCFVFWVCPLSSTTGWPRFIFYILPHEKKKSLCLTSSTPLATKNTDNHCSFSHHYILPFSRMSYWCIANVVFSLWLLSLGNMHLRFTRVILWVDKSSFLLITG